jgi:hypothetical protein
MKLLLLQPTCSALVSCLHGMRRKRSRSVPALMRFICRCLDLGEQPFKCNHELMIKGRRCCIFAYAQSSDIESPALLGCRCPIDGNYPATLIKSGSKDNDLLRKPRAHENSARGVDFQTVNVNDDFWDLWARRKGCSLQVEIFRTQHLFMLVWASLPLMASISLQFAAAAGIRPRATFVQASS